MVRTYPRSRCDESETSSRGDGVVALGPLLGIAGHFLTTGLAPSPINCDIARQHFRDLGRQFGLKRGVVFFDELIKESSFRAMAFVSDNAAIRTGFASGFSGRGFGIGPGAGALRTNRVKPSGE